MVSLFTDYPLKTLENLMKKPLKTLEKSVKNPLKTLEFATEIRVATLFTPCLVQMKVVLPVQALVKFTRACSPVASMSDKGKALFLAKSF